MMIKEGRIPFVMSAHWLWVVMVVAFFAYSVIGQDEGTQSKVLEKAIREMQSSDVKERRKAIYILNDLGKEALPALEFVIRGLSDSDDQVWFQSIDLIAKFGPDATPAIPTLVKNLKSGDRRYRNQIAYRTGFALGRIGQAALPEINKLLVDSSPNVRRTGVMAVGWIGEEASDSISQLISLMDDADTDVRTSVAESIGKIGEAAIAPVISVLRTNTEPMVVTTALESLAEVGVPARKTQAIVSRFLQDDKWPKPVVVASIKSLGAFRLNADSLVDYLNSIIAGGEQEEWQASLRAILMSSERRTLVPWLKSKLKSSSEPEQARALEIAERLGVQVAEVIPELVELITHSEEPEATRAFNAMKFMGSHTFMPLIIEIASENLENMTSSRWEMSLLRSVGHLVVPDLYVALGSSMPSVQWAALDVLGSRRLDHPGLGIRLTELTHSPQASIRAKSLTTLVQVNQSGPRLVPVVQRMISDPAPEVRKAAISAISSLGDSAAALEEAILNGLKDSDIETRLLNLGAVTSLENVPESMTDLLVDGLENLNDRELLARLEAFQTLGEKVKTALPAILSLSVDESQKWAPSWIRAVAAVGPDNEMARQSVLGFLESRFKDIRLAAFESLSQLNLETDQQLKAIAIGLDDSDSGIREISTDLASKLGTSAQPLGPKLLAMIHAGNGDHVFVIEALKLIRLPDTEVYVGLLEHSENAVRLFAVDALARMGKKADSTIPTLRRVSQNDDYQLVRQAASRAIRSITRSQ